ncbi:MAG: hypothetical protein Q8Q35_00750 [Nanoarchaeota archaeon]|nr:hypothetical protein [Nanoarchaeota archaeon]
MNKRGQMTLFIIIGLVVLLLVGVGIYYRSTILDAVGISQTISYPSEVQEVVDMVQDCFEDSAFNGARTLGLTGGYYNLPREIFTLDDVNIPYYLSDGEILTPTVETMQTELSEYVDDIMIGCLALDSYTEFDLERGLRDITTTINTDSIDFVLNYPITVTIDETTTYNLPNEYEYTATVNLGQMRDVAEVIAAKDVDSEDIDFDFLLEQNLTNIELASFNNDTIVYILEDTSALEEGLTFMFAEYFVLEEVTE